MSHEHLCRVITRSLIHQSKNLEALITANLDETDDDWPTWVPRLVFSHFDYHQHPQPLGRHHTFDAGGVDLGVKRTDVTNPSELKLLGFVVDRVLEVSENVFHSPPENSHVYPNPNAEFWGWTGRFLDQSVKYACDDGLLINNLVFPNLFTFRASASCGRLGINRLRILSKLMTAECPIQAAPKFEGDDSISYFLAWITKVNPDIGTLIEQDDSGSISAPRSAEDNTVEDYRWEFMGKQYDRAVQRACHLRRFCITEGGRVGLVPQKAAVGDSICILVGGRTPYVLREDGEAHKYIGECYIHDIMHGEALVSLQEEPKDVKYFTLR